MIINYYLVMGRVLFQLFSLLGSIAFFILITGCNLNTRMSTFVAKGPVAQSQYDLFMVTVWVTGFIFLAVGGAYVYVIIRFRQKKDDDGHVPSQSHGNPLVELGLIGISILLLVIIAIPTVEGIWYTHDTPQNEESLLGSWFDQSLISDESAKEPFTIRAIGAQWWWEFEYPQLGINTANELVIPAGRPIHVELRSVDVIHSFWLPKLAGKVDTIPGRSNSMWMQAGNDYPTWLKDSGFIEDSPKSKIAYKKYLEEEIYDYYYGQCAEYCGDSHARMLFRAHVVSDEELYKWISDQKKGHEAPSNLSWEEWYEIYDSTPEDPGSLLTGDINDGLKLFIGRGQCNTCHIVEGNPRARGVAGPNLTKLAERHSIAAGWLNHRNDDGTIDNNLQYDNFFKWIKKTDNVKPGNLMWNNRQGAGIGMLNPLLNDVEIDQLTKYLQTLN